MSRELIYPVRVEGTAIAHLATSQLDATGATFRAICPAGPLITKPLRLIAVGEPFVWCGACREWAEFVELELPSADPTGGG